MTDYNLTPQPRPDGLIGVRALELLRAGEPGASHELTITYEEGWRLVGNLLSCLNRLSDTRMRSAVAGDCETCRNYRMVTVDDGRGTGRMERRLCPDCRAAYESAAPHHAPWPEAAGI